MAIHMWKEILEQPKVLIDTIEKNNSIIASLVNTIKKKNISMVNIAARGTSDHAAIYAKYVIEIILGVPVALAAPSVFTIYNANLNMKNTLVIGISQSGEAADVIEVIKAARKQGAVTTTITNYENSPLAVSSDFHLNCSAGEEKSVAATKTFTSQLVLILKLVSEWAENSELITVLNDIPNKIESVFSEEDKIQNRIERYRYMEECFVLARGVNYSIAMESALKIQETCYIRAKAYAVSDFYHGPYAMIEKDMPVLVYAPEGKAFNNVKKMIERLKQSGAELIIISNMLELKDVGECFFTIPKTNNDIISPFYNVVIAQMFACKLAIAKGLNPDNPRGLAKVTITK